MSYFDTSRVRKFFNFKTSNKIKDIQLYNAFNFKNIAGSTSTPIQSYQLYKTSNLMSKAFKGI